MNMGIAIAQRRYTTMHIYIYKGTIKVIERITFLTLDIHMYTMLIPNVCKKTEISMETILEMLNCWMRKKNRNFGFCMHMRAQYTRIFECRFRGLVQFKFEYINECNIFRFFRKSFHLSMI